MSRVRLVVFAAAPAWACVSGAAEPFDDAAGSHLSHAGVGVAGFGPAQAGSAAVSGAGPTGGAGSQTGFGGSAPVAGSGSPQAGSVGSAGMSGGGAGGSKPGEDCWSPYACDPVSGSGGAGGSGPVVNNGDCVLDKLLPAGETTYHSMFVPPWQGHQEKPLYSYAALCTALKGFGQFANSGSPEADKRELAAFFAHVAKETAFLEQTDEAGQSSNASDFHGRGAIQLTGQANYQAAGDYLQKNLVGSPGLVSTDAVTNWQTALWFWVVHNNPGTAGTKNCHAAILAGDFAQTTRIINGGIECPGSPSAQTRADYYKSNCSLLSVNPGSSLVC